MSQPDPRLPSKRLPVVAWGYVLWGTIRIGLSILSLPFVRERKDAPTVGPDRLD